MKITKKTLELKYNQLNDLYLIACEKVAAQAKEIDRIQGIDMERYAINLRIEELDGKVRDLASTVEVLERIRNDQIGIINDMRIIVVNQSLVMAHLVKPQGE